MFRTVSSRFGTRFETAGDIVILTGKTIVSALRPPYIYGAEFVSQCLFLLRLCWFPLMVSTIVFGYAAPGLQGGNALRLFGTIDRLGGLFVIASIREFAPFVTAIILAGIGGTAITADLGARKIREELDALQVLGVDPIKSLVVPRFLALMMMTGLFNVFALIFGIAGGVLATLSFHADLAPFFATLFSNASVVDLFGSLLKTALFGAIIAVVSCYKGMTASGGAEGVGRAVNQGVVTEFLCIFAFNVVFTQLMLAMYPDLSLLKMNERGGMLEVPRDLISNMGEIVRFGAKVMGDIFTLRAFKFFGEALRQSSILIFGSMVVVCGLMFIIGLTCGIEAAYLNSSAGAPSYAGFFSAWCDLREAGPYAFGYMMSAKVGTGIVAEIGAMRVTEEIDALDVMGLDSLMYLCASRLLACWMAIPFMYLIGIACCYLASYLAVVVQIGQTSSGGYFLLFWTFQNPTDILFSLIKGIAMATMIVLVGCYYGYTAGGGPVGVGRATAKSMVLNAVGVHIIGMVGTQIFWGKNPRAPVGG